MSFIVLIAFWGAIIRLWSLEGAKRPMIFIILWLVGFFGFPMMHWNGYVFLAFEAILAAILLIVTQYEEMKW